MQWWIIAGIVLILITVALILIFVVFKKKSERVKVKGRVCMPMSYTNSDGKMAMTWDYLNKSADNRAAMRRAIRDVTLPNETPACAFLLSPPYEAGEIFEPFPTINETNLAAADVKIAELVEDDTAVFPVLYTDDKPANPQDKTTWWYNIRKHMDAWRRVHEVIGKRVNGYILSIEANEQVGSIGELQDCIAAMEEAMPGAEYYGVHLQWNGKSNRSSYRWTGGNTTPFNANLVLAECSWHPGNGDKKGFEAMRSEVVVIIGSESIAKLCIHEYNLNPAGAIMPAQRAMLREFDLWGVG